MTRQIFLLLVILIGGKRLFYLTFSVRRAYLKLLSPTAHFRKCVKMHENCKTKMLVYTPTLLLTGATNSEARSTNKVLLESKLLEEENAENTFFLMKIDYFLQEK